MKKLVVLLFLVSFTVCKAQKLSITDPGNAWMVNQPGGDFYDIHLYSFQHDTTINGLPYRILSDTIWHTGFWPIPWAAYLTKVGLIREDTISKKVFIIQPPATQEKLLYDYNMTTGDTVKSGDSTYIVTQKDSVTINNIWHTKWQLTSITHSYYYDIIEGIGSTRGILNSHSMYPYYKYLICFSNPDIFQTTALTYVGSARCKLPLAVEYPSADTKVASIQPNPLTDRSKLLLPSKIASGSLTIYNSEGRNIYSTEINNTDKVNLGQISLPGLYIILVTDKLQGRTYAVRAIQQ
jgi:hypothetical protein